MVLEVSATPKRYIALEGNRRVAALRLLSNPAAMTDLDMPGGMQRPLERLAAVFDKSKIEPIECFEVESREEGRYWIELRHNGENEGRGVVGWKPSVADRFRNKGPASQAFDMVMEHGGFSEQEAESIRSGFSLSTLKRLMESPDVQAMVGLSVKNGKLQTELPGAEVLKPLKRMVLDIAAKKDLAGNRVDSRRFNVKSDMTNYVRNFGEVDKPDLSKKVAERPVEGIEKRELNAGIIGGRDQTGPWKIDARYNLDELIFRIESIAKMRRRIKLTGSDALALLRFGLSRWTSKTLIYLDPPYYERGRELYYDYYQPQDHSDLAMFIRANMDDLAWIVSYDNVAPIKDLYSSFRHVTYNVGYTARTIRIGKEAMFFSPKLTIPALVGPIEQVGGLGSAA